MADTPILPPPAMPVAPPTPQRSDPNTFEEREDAFFDYVGTQMPNAMDAVAANVANNATVALEQARHAATSASQAGDSVTDAAHEVTKAKAEAEKAQTEAAKAKSWAESEGPPEPGARSAKTWAGESEVYRDASAAFAAAAGAAAGMPTMIGQEGKVLTVRPGPAPGDPPSVGWDFSAQVGDVVFSAGDLSGSGFVETGRVYLQSAYPELFAKVGLRADVIAGVKWKSINKPTSNGNPSFFEWLDDTTLLLSSSAEPRLSWFDTASNTWSPTTSAPNGSYYSSGVVVDENTLILSENSLNIHKTSDRLTSWRTIQTPVNGPIVALTPTRLIKINSSSLVGISEDGGETWQGKIPSGANFGGAISKIFRMSDTEAIIGSGGRIYVLKIAENGEAIFYIVGGPVAAGADLLTFSPGRNGCCFAFTAEQQAITGGAACWKIGSGGAMLQRRFLISNASTFTIDWETLASGHIVSANGQIFHPSEGLYSSESAPALSNQTKIRRSPAGALASIGLAAGSPWISGPQFNYDVTTQFYVPHAEIQPGADRGYRSFIKAV